MGVIQVKGNTRCYLSEVGYYNFVYPKKDSCAIIKDDCDVEKLAWIIGADTTLTPVKVKLSNLLINKMTRAFTAGEKHAIVWIEKDELPLSSAGRASDC